jgi:replication fork clamp-binding protein CrfC
MIKQTVNFSQFCDSFSDTYKNNFSYEGKRALFDYLEQLSEDTGEDIELDTIALCCEYTEYENLEEYNKAYNTSNPFDSLEEVEENTQVIRIEGSDGFIIQQY